MLNINQVAHSDQTKNYTSYQGKNLIFLISQPRAGSTLVQRILSGHPDIHTTAEPWIMLHPLYALKAEGVYAEFDSNLARQGLEDFTSHAPEGKGLYVEALRRMGSTLYNRMLEISGKQVFLDKTPRYFFIIPELKKVFPEARFIILLRNPLAVLSSTLKTWFQNNPVNLQNSPNYLDVIKGPLYLIEGIQCLKEDAIVVRYEELVEDDEITIKAICHKLGISFQKEMLNYGSKPGPKGRFGDSIGVKKHNNAVPKYIDKWIKNLHLPQLHRFSLNYMETLGPDIFNIMGYSYEENRNKLLNTEHQKSLEIKIKEKSPSQPRKASCDKASVKNLIRSFEENIKENPFCAQSHNDIGVLYYQDGKKEKVLHHFNKAVRLNPQNTNFIKNLADFYYVEMDNVSDALKLYNQVLEIKPDDTETLLALGTVCADLQKYEDAKSFYSQILQVEPYNQEARKGLDRISHSYSAKDDSAFV